MNRNTESELQSARFVVLWHEVGPHLSRTKESHLDWMFEDGETLVTWASEPLAGFDEAIEVDCQRISNHRLVYLDYEGELGGGADGVNNRGRVTRRLAGRFRWLEGHAAAANQVRVALSWVDESGTREATATFYRSLSDEGLRREESRDAWRLRFSPGR